MNDNIDHFQSQNGNDTSPTPPNPSGPPDPDPPAQDQEDDEPDSPAFIEAASLLQKIWQAHPDSRPNRTRRARPKAVAQQTGI